MRGVLATAFLLAWAASARAATPGSVPRTELVFRMHLSGTVVPVDVFRLKSNIEGRVENVTTSSFTWRTPDQPLAMLAHRELAAMLDAKGVVGQELLEDRWQRVYKPAPVSCPETCYILKVFAKPRVWMKPQSLMFEAARSLKMVGRVRPEDAPNVRDGMEFVFWPADDPTRHLYGRITHFVLDVQGENIRPGGSFELEMTPDRYFDPGTSWEGEMIYLRLTDVLAVPTTALIHHGDEVYLPVRVSTGPSVSGLTQIAAGVEEKRGFLILNDAELNGAQKWVPSSTPPPAAWRTPAAKPAAPSGEVWEPPIPGEKPSRRPSAPQKEKAYGGEDPYGGQ